MCLKYCSVIGQEVWQVKGKSLILSYTSSITEVIIFTLVLIWGASGALMRLKTDQWQLCS